MWIVRDKQGYLVLFSFEKPVRDEEHGIWVAKDKKDACCEVPNDTIKFDIKWEDEPIEVKFEKVFKLKVITFSEEQIKRLQDAADKISEKNVNEEYRLMKCKRYYAPFDAGGDNDFNKGCYYKVNLNNETAEDSEGIRWQIDNIADYFTELNIVDKIIRKIFYQ